MATLRISLKKITSEVKFAERKSALLQNNNVWKKILPFVQSCKVSPPLHHPKNNFMSKWHLIQPLKREIYKKPNAYLLDSCPEQKSLVTYHTLPSLYVCVWLVNTLTSTAPIGSPIICMWSPTDICEQWERNSLSVKQTLVGQEAWRTPKKVGVAGYSRNHLRVNVSIQYKIWHRYRNF